MALSDTDLVKSSKSVLKRVPWNPWYGVGFILLVFYITQQAAAILVSIYPALRHWHKAETLAWFHSVVAQSIFIFVVECLSIGAIYLFLKRGFNLNLSAIGLKRPRLLDPLVGIVGVIPYFVLYGIAVSVISYYIPSFNVSQSQDIGFHHVQGGLALILTFLSLVVLPPLAEEIMVRGFLFSSLQKAMPIVYAAILTSALFGAAHLQEGGSGGLLWIGAVDTFILSLVLIYLRVKTGSLWASITLHAIKNGIAFATLFVIHAR
jgi:membrane protease YdiL (CAAX protease family)